MWEVPQKIDWKEATNDKLNIAEKNAVNTLVKAVKSNVDVKESNDTKEKIQQKNDFKSKIDNIVYSHFDINESKSNVENQKTKQFLYESLLDQMWIGYSKGESLYWGSKETLDAAYHIMMLLKPDEYGKNSANYKVFVEWDINKNSWLAYSLDWLKSNELFNSFVEQELQNIYNKPSDLYIRKMTQKQTISAEDYQTKKAEYKKQWWTSSGVEREIPWGPEKKEIIAWSPIHVGKQEFFRGQSDVDVSRGIESKVPKIKEEIQKLKNMPGIQEGSIKINVSSSVSNIAYADNKSLIQNRSNYIASMLSSSFDKNNIIVSDPEYSGYGAEWWPSYPPTSQDLQETFSNWSDALKALQAIPWFTSLDDVSKSMETQKWDSPFFDVLEQYLYRPFQYADISISYKKEESVPTNMKVVDLEKRPMHPDVDDDSRFLKSVKIIAENPYYEQMKTSPLAKAWDAARNSLNPWEIGRVTRPTINVDGISYPYTKYIELNMSDNKLTQSTKWIWAESISKDFQKHLANNKSLEERKKWKPHAISDKMYVQLKTADDVVSFSKNIIKSDKDAGRTVTNKEQSKFIIDYIKTQN